ncbi:hypothetical protein C2869_06745 [Saccharobesus litoralis]|uniref:Gylcosyl hydrolase 115 C-terminal domain-containing protein n=1 Tax=Saccharobesus litoralis TaxID=2172099 RepID=A0A2S0VPP1_9ALTE|nr:hypothetical protein [Saccharobesus litoralis]AWB66152.1 hypothetical protein C2869_06745 [Saccharobesus litoralis]
MKFKSLYSSLLAGLACLSFSSVAASQIPNHGFVVIEAEDFASQHLDDKRRWLVFSKQNHEHGYADSDLAHYHDASLGRYIEILPDTRANHSEALIIGENFSSEPGTVAVLTYPVYFAQAGTYYVWARAYSTGSEDNGVHIGLNGQWPETSQRLQLCDGKHVWTWSSAQRVPDNHCGTPRTITLEVPAPGVHTVMISMREDGFELDKLLLTTDETYQPQGIDKTRIVAKPKPLALKQDLFGIKQYKKVLRYPQDLQVDNNIAQYQVKRRDAGEYRLTLVTVANNENAAKYQVQHNGKVIGEFQNPIVQTKQQENDQESGQEQHFHIDKVTLTEGDSLKVIALANSKQKTGQWRALAIVHQEELNLGRSLSAANR